MNKINKKILGLTIAIFTLTVMSTPVFAVGPVKTVGKNPHVEIHGFNTQMWLPSGVMNEWIENPMLPGPVVVTVKDAAKFQIKKALVIDNPVMAGMVFGMENKWTKLSKETFGAFLAMIGFDPSLADRFPQGIYMQLIYIGYSVEDLPSLT